MVTNNLLNFCLDTKLTRHFEESMENHHLTSRKRKTMTISSRCSQSSLLQLLHLLLPFNFSSIRLLQVSLSLVFLDWSFTASGNAAAVSTDKGDSKTNSTTAAS